MIGLVVVLAVLLLAAGVGLVWLARERQGLRRQVARSEQVREGQAEEQTDIECTVARLEASLGALVHGVVIFDDEGTVVYRNDPAAAYLDARHGDALVEEAITTMAQVVEPGTVRERELEVYGPPRRTLVLRAVSLAGGANADAAASSGSTLTPVPRRRGPSGVFVLVEDITERRQLENVRRDFVANVSHELKTPVGALALLAETLMTDDDPEVVRRLAERMVGEAFRVAHTIEDLLELSRLEADAGQLEERLPATVFMDEAVERVRAAAERRGIPLRVTAPPRELTVQGERRQLVSAVANLLDNAVKYSEAGGPVELRARDADEWVDVEVRDYGIGIPRRDLQRIFERFYRVDRARSRETGGTGLGLAIVRHVASNHRGEVRVESREGEGSRFTLRLPAARSDAAVGGERSDRGEQSTNGAEVIDAKETTHDDA